ncbi:MAG TPA: Hsp20/alpha crystallin family protein [Vicinamibacteria bacterium]|nr:Hsp20/alpha crystallin family protein [Vicinamibacteria bacterium]
MPLHRQDPLRELLDLQERMNRLFDETMTRERLDEPALLQGTWAPLADVVETAEAYFVELELPGLDRDDVTIQAQGDELVVRGERRPATSGSPVFHRLERRYGPFARGFRFAEEVDPDRITAAFSDGLLRLEVPKVRPRGGTRIRVDKAD